MLHSPNQPSTFCTWPRDAKVTIPEPGISTSQPSDNHAVRVRAAHMFGWHATPSASRELNPGWHSQVLSVALLQGEASCALPASHWRHVAHLPA